MRILLGHLASNGDCLYATTVARQIKADFPGCHLTWAISSLCRDVIRHNPDVDDVWEVTMADWADMGICWHAFEKEAWSRVARGDFDRAFMTQISPALFGNYDGTIRPSVLRSYPHPITVPVETVIELSNEERDRVARFVADVGLEGFDDAVLFECASKSGQSFVTPDFALEIARKIVAERPKTAVLLSTHLPIETGHPGIVHAGALSMRETALLTHHVDAFVGCGSGLTVIATSSAAKPGLPNIQILSESTSVYASFRHDFEYFGKEASHFLEITRPDAGHIARAVLCVLENGIAAARKTYDAPPRLDFSWYRQLVESQLLQSRQYLEAARSLTFTVRRYGWLPELKAFAAVYVEPYLEFDPAAAFANRRREIADFRSLMEQPAPAVPWGR